MEELKPNYYAIIPATVRYDKELSPNAKLLYGEITSLCNEKGYCWATNQYFENLYSVSDRTIRNLLKQLADKNYIIIELENNTKRKIFITDTPEKNFRGGGKIISAPSEENFLHNNKENNKTGIRNKKEELNELMDFLEDYNWLESND